MRAHRVDGNQSVIVATLVACGVWVRDCTPFPGMGCDLVGIRNGHVGFLEVKDGRRHARRLTDNEKATREEIVAAGGEYVVLATVDDAVRWANGCV